jgi:hypothetical protein
VADGLEEAPDAREETAAFTFSRPEPVQDADQVAAAKANATSPMVRTTGWGRFVISERT